MGSGGSNSSSNSGGSSSLLLLVVVVIVAAGVITNYAMLYEVTCVNALQLSLCKTSNSSKSLRYIRLQKIHLENMFTPHYSTLLLAFITF